MEQESITATVVKEGERNHFMSNHFRSAFMTVENGIYNTMDKICANYKGGYWQFIELSNGGAYMRLDTEQEQMHVSCGNYFKGGLSPDAVSIAATMYAISAATFRFPDNEVLSDHYYLLRDYAAQHVEAAGIFAAID